jgi:predicted Zn-dependent protease
MHKTDQDGVFQQSVQAYRLGRLDEAARGFRGLVDSGTIDPLHQSFHGLMLALRENRRQEGRELCERALVLSPDRPEAYLNLARVYKTMGWKRRSIDTLRRGLSARPKDPALLREIRHASPRRKPPFATLERDHPLNKFLGKLQARLASAPRSKQAAARR